MLAKQAVRAGCAIMLAPSRSGPSLASISCSAQLSSAQSSCFSDNLVLLVLWVQQHFIITVEKHIQAINFSIQHLSRMRERGTEQQQQIILFN